MEILLLCGNGYGLGAQKLVRGMFERAVTARYLFAHPDEVDDFLAYYRVSDHKFLMAAKDSGSNLFSPDQEQKIKRDYESGESKVHGDEVRIVQNGSPESHMEQKRYREHSS